MTLATCPSLGSENVCDVHLRLTDNARHGLWLVYDNVAPELARCARAHLMYDLRHSVGDVVQDVFLVFVRESLSGALRCLNNKPIQEIELNELIECLGNCRSYLFGVLSNKCRELYRRARMETDRASQLANTVTSQESDLLSQLIHDEQFHSLHAAIERLPQHLAQLVQLYYFSDFSVGRIAQDTQLPMGTVKRRLYEARKHLAKSLRVTEPELAFH